MDLKSNVSSNMNGKEHDVLWRIFMKKALLSAVRLGSD